MKNRIKNWLCAVAIIAAASIVSTDASAQRGFHGGFYGGGGFRGGVYGGGFYGGAKVYGYGGFPRYTYIPWGGINYGFYNGYFYAPYAYGLRLIAPPLGITVGALPYGYYPFYWGNYPYYYYGGIFYGPYGNNNGYEVVAPPLGASVPSLPRGAQKQVINGQEYYSFYGTFYQKTISNNGKVWYKVVGTDGKLNTANGEYQQPQQQGQPQDNDPEYEPAPRSQATPPSTATPPSSQVAPGVGDLVSKLPGNCTTIKINGNMYYEAPDGTYYQQVFGDDNKVMYQIVDAATLEPQPQSN